ncbi:MAG: MotA/TolQ/ExbB proton channel family protein [Gemmatimonadetes bacterium]|nr:MAG: MotA/TolQ/ExbB proton channel family protein [Gemmatimonadota bacterium]
MSLLSILLKGGFLMIPLAICSFIATVIIIERLFVLNRAKIDTEKFMERIKHTVSQGNAQAGLMLCEDKQGPIATIVKAGLERHDRPREVIREAIENAGKTEIYMLERGLGTLATIAGIAPLLGFLGTVTGMIQAFMKIAELEGNVNPSILASGIWEALLTTAVGLAVGIPVLIFYNYLVGRVQRFVFEMEKSSTELVDALIWAQENKT